MRKRSVSGVRKVRRDLDGSDNNQIEPSESLTEHSGSLLRDILDEAGFETGVGTYTYSDMIGSVRNTFESVSTSILNGISGAISNMNICGQIADMNESVEQYLVQNFDQMGDNPNDQLRDIANSLRVQMEDNIRSKIESPEYNNYSTGGYGSPVINHNPPLPSFSPAPPAKQRKYPDVEIKINVYGYVEQVKIKYNDKYLSVPFENSDNPYYIQEIFDEWFIINEYEYIEATYDIYEALIDISPNDSLEWLEKHVEWIGFSYDGNSLTPSSFEVFKY